jgi:hypothetical protein
MPHRAWAPSDPQGDLAQLRDRIRHDTIQAQRQEKPRRRTRRRTACRNAAFDLLRQPGVEICTCAMRVVCGSTSATARRISGSSVSAGTLARATNVIAVRWP